jgi:hypothetical protein
MADVALHPWDITKVYKGWVMQTSDVEKYLQMPASHPQFRLKLLNLGARLSRELFEHTGAWHTVTTDGDCLNVLTDSAASKYNASAGDRAIQKLRDAAKRLISVDVSKLPAEQVPSHERAIGTATWRVRATRPKERKAFESKREERPLLNRPASE